MSTVLITGGTGLIGRALSKALLEEGYAVIVLTRDKTSVKGSEQFSDNLCYAEWDVKNQTIDEEAIRKADYIVHLAGAGVADKRWTESRKQEIVNSRVDSSKLIVDSLQNIQNTVKVVVSASAIGWYLTPQLNPSPAGEARDLTQKLTETDPPANDFLGKTCQLWEKSIEAVTGLGKRLVTLRTGIVLSTEGGALKEFLKPLHFGIAAILGNGKQIISWIHIDDLVDMYIHAIENENMQGVYNAVAPRPVSNKELTLQLAKSRGKFFIPFHVPSFVLKLVLGEMSTEVLKTAAISSGKIQATGFAFHFPAISSATNDLTNAL